MTPSLSLELMFTKSLKSPATQKTYGRMLKNYQSFLSASRLEDLLGSDHKALQMNIISFLLKLDEKGMSYQTRQVSLAAIKHFYEINDITLNWKKIAKFLGKKKLTVQDRPYTHDEIKKMLTKCDERKRVVILLLASTGMRLGALAELRLKHMKRVQDLYQFTVYPDDEDAKYITFCTPECAQAIDSYLEYRRRYGERITPESPLIRNQFDKTKIEEAAMARPVGTHLIQVLVWNLIYDAGLRERPTAGNTYKRKEVMAVHGLRKFFSTELNGAYKNKAPFMVELLLGHDTGLTGVYNMPSEEERLEFYMGGMDALTINEENRLKRENQELKVKVSEMDELREAIADIRRDVKAGQNPPIQ